jgi:hypothetical protein
MPFRDGPVPQHTLRISPLFCPIVVFALVAAALAVVARVVAQHTVAVVTREHLLPRWDLATHLGRGWLDYHLLATGQVHRLLWDVWLQGYWPPVLSLFQVPFYIGLGGITAGLWSALAAFVLVGLTGCGVLWSQWRCGAVLSIALFVSLLVSSPFLLAYASVPMTETIGALTQLLVLLAWVHYTHKPTAAAADVFAASLTVLFFTKYNYFFLLVVPLLIHEWLDRTQHSSTACLRHLGYWTRRIASTPTGAFLGLYLVALLIIIGTGGFDVRVAGRRISVHTIGNSGYVVLYGLLARLWYLHRQRRIDWGHVRSLDPRVGPLLKWFVLPVTIWFASPYPNHIRDFTNLIFNRSIGDATIRTGIGGYLDVLRNSYFYNEWMLAGVVIAFCVAAVRYRHQAPLMRLLVLAVPLQCAAIGFHQTRSPRFLLLTVVLLCLAASAEVGGWFARSTRGRIASVLLAPPILIGGVVAARHVMTEARFHTVAFENYTNSPNLVAALNSIRAELTVVDRVAIVGQSNELPPALFRWELGPPSGLRCFPFEVGGANGTALGLATKVLLIRPSGPGIEPLDPTTYYFNQRREVLEREQRGDLRFDGEYAVPDLRVTLRMYERAVASGPTATCY